MKKEKLAVSFAKRSLCAEEESEYCGDTVGTFCDPEGAFYGLISDGMGVEDIVDTGLTMHKMLETLQEKKPASLAVASLFLKPARLRVPVEVKYSAFEIPDRFIVGYGLDYDGLGRNLPDVYDVKE